VVAAARGARCRVKAMELALKDGASTDHSYRSMLANDKSVQVSDDRQQNN
jgi:hypothetical protein